MSAESINPLFYSLRNCPYAMRARMAIYASGQSVQLRELCLDSKPTDFLMASPKATVPVLVLPNGKVIEQSLEIMCWTFNVNDSDNYLISDNRDKQQQMLRFIELFDREFISSLESYRSAKRYHDENLLECRKACERYLQQLEQRLQYHRYLFSDNPCVADLAIIPFIRQLARVERQWYLNSPYPQLRNWLNGYLQSRMFSKVMTKYPVWTPTNEQVIFKL